MGLSIYFTDRATQRRGPANNGQLRQSEYVPGYHLVRDTVIDRHPWNYPDLDRLQRGYEGYFIYEARINKWDASFQRAGYSYSGWKDFKSGMAEFFLGVSVDEVFRNPDMAPGKTMFYSLINFRDSEGFITPSAVRMLASDFRYAERVDHKGAALQDGFFEYMAGIHGEYYSEAYSLLREGVYHAARNGGLVIFE